jgi:hypothetical protein
LLQARFDVFPTRSRLAVARIIFEFAIEQHFLFVESSAIRPSNVRFKVPVLGPPHAFDTLSVTVDVPEPIGVPEMVPVLVFRDKPRGRKFALKVSGVVPCVLGVKENGVPVSPDLFQ